MRCDSLVSESHMALWERSWRVMECNGEVALTGLPVRGRGGGCRVAASEGRRLTGSMNRPG